MRNCENNLSWRKPKLIHCIVQTFYCWYEKHRKISIQRIGMSRPISPKTLRFNNAKNYQLTLAQYTNHLSMDKPRNAQKYCGINRASPKSSWNCIKYAAVQRFWEAVPEPQVAAATQEPLPANTARTTQALATTEQHHRQPNGSAKQLSFRKGEVAFN